MKSIISDKIEICSGSINRLGMFAKEVIEPQEIVYIKGGHILTRKEIFSSSVINSYLPISDDLFIGSQKQEEENQIKLYNNHSCAPNCAVRGDIVFIATQIISQGEELFIDYAFVDNEVYRFKCNCGSSDCRKIITGYDWQLKAVQRKYNKAFFSCYIQSKISGGLSVDINNKINKKIKDFRKTVFVDELGFNLEDEFDGAETKYLHCCLYARNELVAYARLLIQDTNVRVGRVAVRKDWRGKGYGSQIMFWAETEALKHNVADIEVHALQSAIGFYKKIGYSPVGEQFEEEGKPHNLMTKHLELN